MSPPSPRILEPGLRLLPPGTERYVIRGGGATVLPLRAGDRLEVVDPEGRQRAELVAFDGKGNADAGILGMRASGAAQALAAMAGSADEEAKRVAASLRSRGLELSGARAAHLFAPDSAPGERETLTAERDGVVFLAAPGGPMRVDAQDPPTDLTLFVHRGTTPREGEAPPLPEPLAALRLDVHIEAGTVRTYEVKAGEFIQIIDVEGRECSDFQAFAVAALERDVERCIDATVTRTLMGAAYPGPGLLSKYYDVDMQPLVEVVRDTVGRHDTFGVACSAKYYEDLGYPGHVKLLGQLQPRTRPLRRGRAAGLDGRQLLLQHQFRRQQPALPGRALVAPGRLCPDPGAHRPRLRVLGLSPTTSTPRMPGTRPTSTCGSTRERTPSARRLHSE